MAVCKSKVCLDAFDTLLKVLLLFILSTDNDLRNAGVAAGTASLAALLLTNLSLLDLLVILGFLVLLVLALRHDTSEEAAESTVDSANWAAEDVSDAVEPLIREDSDEDGPWQTESSEDDTDSPLNTINVGNAEGATTDEDDGNLCTNHDAIDTNKEEVTLKTSKDVELVVKTTIVEFVEDLHPDKCVEDHSIELELPIWAISENASTGKVEDECDDKLKDCLTDNHLPHIDGDEWCLLASGFAVQDLWGWWISGKSKSSQRVHDQVNPEKLDSSQNRVHVWVRYGRDKCKQNSGDIDCDLELENVNCKSN